MADSELRLCNILYVFVCRCLPLSYVLTNWFKRDKLVKVITQCHLVAMLSHYLEAKDCHSVFGN